MEDYGMPAHNSYNNSQSETSLTPLGVNRIPQLNILSRYGLMDRMNDGFSDPPDRSKWSMNELYKDWKSHGFFKDLQELGNITFSKDGGPFVSYRYNASYYSMNRHRILALSCFVSSKFFTEYQKVKIIAPHEIGGNFVGVFERIGEFDIKYTNEYGNEMRYHFDNTQYLDI